ncbi:hypothetical protein [Glutamicibacter arilaitensis]|uniref:hypothetical protein n=1 Tax=Glutamicibacter arilaitensis TaxID=256701 RepID=UPI003F8EC24B
MSRSGKEFIWELSDSGDEEYLFTNEMQSGMPVSWTGAGILEFGFGLRQAITANHEREVRVQIPGQVDYTATPEGDGRHPTTVAP